MKIPLSTAARLALTVVLAGLAIALSITANFFMVQHEISKSQTQWCDTLHLLTERPVPKPANPGKDPSRLANYLFYQDLVKLKDQFGCHS